MSVSDFSALTTDEQKTYVYLLQQDLLTLHNAILRNSCYKTKKPPFRVAFLFLDASFWASDAKGCRRQYRSAEGAKV
jgi:hypothetical protein